MDNWIRLYALGDDFNVDAFLATTSMPANLIWRRGEPKGGGGAFYPTSGVAFNLGDAKATPFPEQESIALAFLKTNRGELKALGQFPGVTHFTLGLQYSREFHGNFLGFCMCASPLLMWHLLDVGCTLSHYVWLERTDVEDNA